MNIMAQMMESIISRPQLKRLSSLELVSCEKLNPKLKCQFTVPSNSWITGIDVCKHNRILLSDGQNGRVFLYAIDGTLIHQEKYDWPIWDCGIMSSNQIALLTEEDIKIYTTDFQYIRRIKLKNFHPRHMVVDQDNFVIVADIVQDTIRIYNGFDGQLLTAFGARANLSKSHHYKAKNYYQTAVTVNSKDEIVVADPVNPVMRVFRSNGGLIESMPIINETGLETEIIHPRAVCVDHEDRIWFAEDGGKHIRLVHMYGNNNAQHSGFVQLAEYGLCKPQAMVCTKDGQLIVVDEANQTAVLDISAIIS